MKQTTVKYLGILLVIVVVLFGGFVLWTNYQVAQKAGVNVAASTPTPDPSSPEYAFRTGIETFYTADSTTGYDAWKKSLCAVMDATGCAAVNPIFKPYYWDMVEKNKQRVSAVVLTAEKIEENTVASTGVKLQAWRGHTMVTNLITNQQSPVDLYGVITYDSAKRVWRFQRIVFNTELGKYQPTATPVK